MEKISRKGEIWSALSIGVGVILRLFYVAFSSIYDRQYDIGMMDLDAGHTVSGGHLAYIQYLYHNLSLPDMDPTTVYQFHHPPLHHFISALWMRFLGLFVSDTSVLAESIQIVPFVCSVVILIFAYKILKEFDISPKARAFALMILSVHPSLILLSGSVNNDTMALMFSFMVIFYALRWAKDYRFKDILKMALCLGLGISTKQNVAELAFPLALLFLYVFVRCFRKKATGLRMGKLVKEYALFLLISVPLGMWFYIRNLLKYNISMLWVYELPKDSWQYTGNIPLINRFLWPIPSEILDNILHFKMGCGYNVWVQITRTSVLGEWDMASVPSGIKLVAVLLMMMGAILAAVAFINFVRVFATGYVKRKGKRLSMSSRILFLSGYVTIMVFYLVFVYKYPQQCSMHFRYIEILLLFPLVALGYRMDLMKSRFERMLMRLLLVVFSVLSLIMTIVWCLV